MLSVWMLTRLTEIVTAAHRDLQSCTHRTLTAHQKLSQYDVLCCRANFPKTPKFGVNMPFERHSPWAACYHAHWYHVDLNSSNMLNCLLRIGGHVSLHVDESGAAARLPREPEPVWRRPVVKPPMPDALWEATRTEVLGSELLHPIAVPGNYQLYQVSRPHV